MVADLWGLSNAGEAVVGDEPDPLKRALTDLLGDERDASPDGLSPASLHRLHGFVVLRRIQKRTSSYQDLEDLISVTRPFAHEDLPGGHYWRCLTLT